MYLKLLKKMIGKIIEKASITKVFQVKNVVFLMSPHLQNLK